MVLTYKGESMRSMICGCLAMMMVGCSSVSRIPLDETLTGRQLVMTTMSDPHALAPTAQRSWIELCDVTANQTTRAVFYRAWQHVFENCSTVGEIQNNTATGYLSGLMQPLIYSGAAVGSAFLIGDGLSKSGPTVNQMGGNQSQSNSLSNSFKNHNNTHNK
jgi:hypothetical protein